MTAFAVTAQAGEGVYVQEGENPGYSPSADSDSISGMASSGGMGDTSGSSGLVTGDDLGSSDSIDVTDHTTSHDVEDTDPWDPIGRTHHFDVNDDQMCSWLKFYPDGAFTVRWKWYDQNGDLIVDETHSDSWSGGWYKAWYCIWGGLGDGWDLQGPVTIDVFINGNYKYTESDPTYDEKPEVNPYLEDHHTCNDHNNPETSADSTFYRDDPEVCYWTLISTDNIDTTHDWRCRFIDPAGNVYSTSDSVSLEGDSPKHANKVYCWTPLDGTSMEDKPGTWKAQTILDGTVVGASNFEVVNQDPSRPSAPSGPSEAYAGDSVEFCASTTDPDGDDVRFQFDWDDGSTSGWTNWVSSGSNACASHVWDDTGTYSVQTRAEDTFGARTSWSSGSSINILRAVPTPPQNLDATVGDAPGEIDLTWDPPADDGKDAVDNYKLYRDGSFVKDLGNVLSYTDTGLADGTTYSYYVTAENSAGESDPSNEDSATTHDVPTAPRNLAAVQADSAGAIDLSWDPPSDNGGLSITNYKVYRGTSPGSYDKVIDVGETLSYTDTGLADGTTYHYAVAAENAVGVGPKSNEDSASTAAPPSAPQNLDAAQGSAPGEIDLCWDAPADDGGLSITNYKLYRGTSSGNAVFVADLGVTLCHTDTGLEDDTTYHYQVAAENEAGVGDRSSEDAATTASVPSKPRNLVAAMGDEPGEIVLDWDAPADDGGLALDSYKVYRRSPGGSPTLVDTVPASQTSFDDQGLPDDVERIYEVSAVNPVGEGPTSDEDNARTASVPDAPPRLDAQTGDAPGEIDLDWDATADDGGLALDGYRICRGHDAQSIDDCWDIGVQTSYTDRNLPDDVQRCYTVQAVNPVGASDVSPSDCAKTASRPTEPLNVTAHGAGIGEVELAWDAPADDGGLAVTGYVVFRTTVSGSDEAIRIDVGDTRTYTDEDLKPGVRYHYTVVAVNPVGEGPDSAEASARAGVWGHQDDQDGDLVPDFLEATLCDEVVVRQALNATEDFQTWPGGRCESPDDWDPWISHDDDGDLILDIVEPAMCFLRNQVGNLDEEVGEQVGVCEGNDYAPPPDSNPGPA